MASLERVLPAYCFCFIFALPAVPHNAAPSSAATRLNVERQQRLLRQLSLNNAIHASGLDPSHKTLLPRWLLWTQLLILLTVTLATLAWLVSRYEVNRAQQHVQADAVAALTRIEQALQRNVGELQGLGQLDDAWRSGSAAAAASVGEPVAALVRANWSDQANVLLKLRREILALELRNTPDAVGLRLTSPHLHPDAMGAASSYETSETGETRARHTCRNAAAERRAAYSSPYFVPSAEMGSSVALMDVCVPIIAGERVIGLTRATYGLRGILLEHAWNARTPLRQISLLSVSGQRLATVGYPVQNARAFSDRQTLSLAPSTTLVLNMEGWWLDLAPNGLLVSSGVSGDLSGLGDLGGLGSDWDGSLGASAAGDNTMQGAEFDWQQAFAPLAAFVPSWLIGPLERLGWGLTQWLSVLLGAVSLALLSLIWLLVRDSQRRHRIEQELSQALAMRQAMENALVTGVRIMDTAGRTTYVNPAFVQMVGWSASELAEQHLPLYWPPEFKNQYARALAELLASHTAQADALDALDVAEMHALQNAAHANTESHLAPNTDPNAEAAQRRSRSFEMVLMHRDGTRLPVLVFESPLIDGQGQQLGWMSAFVDLREQRRLQAISQASQERLQAIAPLVTAGEMASTISHEITQPLMAISSYANGSLNILSQTTQTPLEPQTPSAKNALLGRGYEASAEPLDPIDTLSLPELREALRDMRRAMQRISTQAERAGQVIKSVRNFLRQKTSGGSRTQTSAAALLDAVMPLIVLQTQKNQVQLRTHMPEAAAHAPIVCDATLIEQVILNLARNAVQAMNEQREERRVLTLSVEIHTGPSPLCPSLAETATSVVFSVADLGTGIAPEAAEHIFSPFFTTRAEGMGLGLNLCRTIIEQHGGALRHRPGNTHGTVFSFALPIV